MILVQLVKKTLNSIRDLQFCYLKKKIFSHEKSMFVGQYSRKCSFILWLKYTIPYIPECQAHQEVVILTGCIPKKSVCLLKEYDNRDIGIIIEELIRNDCQTRTVVIIEVYLICTALW